MLFKAKDGRKGDGVDEADDGDDADDGRRSDAERGVSGNLAPLRFLPFYFVQTRTRCPIIELPYYKKLTRITRAKVKLASNRWRTRKTSRTWRKWRNVHADNVVATTVATLSNRSQWE